MGTFIIKKTPSGGFNFSLLAANKEKIAVASQVYTTKTSCKAGIASVGKFSVKGQNVNILGIEKHIGLGVL